MHAACGALVVSPCNLNATVGVLIVGSEFLPVSRPCRCLTAFHASFLGSPSLNFVETCWACFRPNAGFNFCFCLFFSVLPLFHCARLSGVIVVRYVPHRAQHSFCIVSYSSVHQYARRPRGQNFSQQLCRSQQSEPSRSR